MAEWTQYPGVLNAALPADWTLEPGNDPDIDHYRTAAQECIFTIDTGSGSGPSESQSDGEATDRFTTDTVDSFIHDPANVDVEHLPQPTQWIPIAGSPGRIEFAYSQLSYGSTRDGKSWTTLLVSRILSKDDVKLWAQLECATPHSGTIGPKLIKESLGSLQFVKISESDWTTSLVGSHPGGRAD